MFTVTKRLAFLIVVISLTWLLHGMKASQAAIERHERSHAIAMQQLRAAQSVRDTQIAKKAEQRRLVQLKEREAAKKPPEPPSPSAVSCREAIRRTWPSQLHDGAYIVLQHENRAEDPTAVGAVNSDGVGSQDFGCFQINNHWHAAFFAQSDWRDPVANAAYAYTIYQERGNWTAWYAVEGILW